MASQSTVATYPTQSSSLSRGRACITCRRKKMKCDSVRPFCGPCSLTRNPSHCEYTDKQGRTFTEVLEERLRLLRVRIKELEDHSKDPPVLLRNPYPQKHGGFGTDTANFLPMNSPARLSERLDFATEPVLSRLQTPTAFPEQNIEQSGMSQMVQGVGFAALLQVFLPHASRLHFALHVPTFLQDIARPVGDPLRPHACLISSVLLWALCIMGPNAEYVIHESYHLKVALETILTAHSGAVGRHRVQAIQAEALLALYFFNDARVVEGRYHLAAAAAGALACGLHQISASYELPTAMTSASFFSGLGTGAGQQLLLEPPRDALELGERTNVFWSVYALDHCWSVALGCPSVIVDYPTTGAVIKSALPRPLLEYENMSIGDSWASVGSSANDFLDSSGDYSIFAQPSSSSIAFVVAAALFERATRIMGSQDFNEPSPTEGFLQDVDKLRGSIEQFNAALQEQRSAGSSSTGGPSVPDDASKAETRMRTVARSLGFAATIQLQYPLWGRAEADTRCRAAVREIVGVIRHDSELSQGQLDRVDFFLGIVWLSAARVLLNEAAVLASAPVTPTHTQLSTGMSAEGSASSAMIEWIDAMQEPPHQLLGTLRAQEISEDLETLLGAIRALGQTCPLISSQLETLEEHKQD